MTTWNSRCGIAQYSKNLANEFLGMGDSVVVLSNDVGEQIQGQKKVIGPCFGVHVWGENPGIDIGKIKKAVKDCDVFHIQYQGSFYGPEFNKMVSLVRPKVKKIVITLHDSSKHSFHRFDNFDTIIVHNKFIDKGATFIPMPIPKIKEAKIFTMGMNRSQDEKIQKVCNDLSLYLYKHDGKEEWLDQEELILFIKQYDAVVLWYNNVNIIGSSASVATALASYRPVFVNNIPWFNTFNTVFKFEDEEDLKEQLTINLNLDIIEKHNFKNCAIKHKEIYMV